MVETKVSDTVFSLIGLKPIIDDILVEVTEPLRQYLCQSNESAEQEFPVTRKIPKFILITGRPGCGKRSLVSAIVNELGRGMRRKSADVYYRDKKIVLLDWYQSPWDFELDEYLMDMLDKAKSREDGRNFTVIHCERFEVVCPAQGRNRGPSQEDFIQAMKQELSSCPPGLVLFVATTTYPEEVDPDILNLVDFRYDIPEYSKDVKSIIVRSFFELECATISQPDLDLIMTIMGSRSLRCLKTIALEATEKARTRMNENFQHCDYIQITRQDLMWLIRQDEGFEGEMVMHEEPIPR